MQQTAKTGGAPTEQPAATPATSRDRAGFESARSGKSDSDPRSPRPDLRGPAKTPTFTDWAAI